MKRRWKRFLGSYLLFLFLLGLLLVLCMGCPLGMVLLVALEKDPLLFWAAAALVPTVPALARTAREEREGASKR